MHFDRQAQLDELHRVDMEFNARKQRAIQVARSQTRRGPIYGRALAGLGHMLVTVGEALRAEYGGMVERGEYALEHIRRTSEHPAVKA